MQKRFPDIINKVQDTGLALATGNQHKIQELKSLLKPLKIQLYGANEILNKALEVEENGKDFSANAAIKAHAYFQVCQMPVLADDSGLVVDALEGAPGIHSARFGGPGLNDLDRCHLLLDKLQGIPFVKRTARFVCVLALCTEDSDGKGGMYFFDGIAEGYIMEKMEGTNGFGYDPLFYDAELKESFANISAIEKNKRSHRGKAIQKLLDA